jgi:hypothetical protein
MERSFGSTSFAERFAETGRPAPTRSTTVATAASAALCEDRVLLAGERVLALDGREDGAQAARVHRDVDDEMAALAVRIADVDVAVVRS